jgi:hypothetical protein
MGTLMQNLRQTEKNKRMMFLGVGGVGLLLTFLGSPFIGGVSLAAGIYLGWQWFKFRIKNGIKF